MAHGGLAWAIGAVIASTFMSGCTGDGPPVGAGSPSQSVDEQVMQANHTDTCEVQLHAFIGDNFRRSLGGVKADGAVLARWLTVRDAGLSTIDDYAKFDSIRPGEELRICVGSAAHLVPTGPPGAPPDALRTPWCCLPQRPADAVVVVFPVAGAPITDAIGPQATVLNLFEQLRDLPGTHDIA